MTPSAGLPLTRRFTPPCGFSGLPEDHAAAYRIRCTTSMQCLSRLFAVNHRQFYLIDRDNCRLFIRPYDTALAFQIKFRIKTVEILQFSQCGQLIETLQIEIVEKLPGSAEQRGLTRNIPVPD